MTHTLHPCPFCGGSGIKIHAHRSSTAACPYPCPFCGGSGIKIHAATPSYPDLCGRIALLERRLVSTDRERVSQIEALKERLNAMEPKAPSQETVRRDLDAWGDREEAMAARAAGNAPPHYARMPDGYQPIDVAEKWITSAGDNVTPYQAALWFQIVKYAGRWQNKHAASDLRKLIDYAQRLLAALEGNR